VKNAQAAQSPVILIGGAVPTALRGRGALQDIDQISLLKTAAKWTKAVRRIKDLVPALEEAFHQAMDGVPGPVPFDLLYDEEMVRVHMRHQRRLALKDVDFVMLAGAPTDYRLDWGTQLLNAILDKSDFRKGSISM
jgi:glyoxylate carboligase